MNGRGAFGVGFVALLVYLGLAWAVCGCAHVKRDAVVDPGVATARVIQDAYDAGVRDGNAQRCESDKNKSVVLEEQNKALRSLVRKTCEECEGRVFVNGQCVSLEK